MKQVFSWKCRCKTAPQFKSDLNTLTVMIVLVSDDSRVLYTGTQAAPATWLCSLVSVYHLLCEKALASLWIYLMMISTSSHLISFSEYAEYMTEGQIRKGSVWETSIKCFKNAVLFS